MELKKFPVYFNTGNFLLDKIKIMIKRFNEFINEGQSYYDRLKKDLPSHFFKDYIESDEKQFKQFFKHLKAKSLKDIYRVSGVNTINYERQFDYKNAVEIISKYHNDMGETVSVSKGTVEGYPAIRVEDYFGPTLYYVGPEGKHL